MGSKLDTRVHCVVPDLHFLSDSVRSRSGYVCVKHLVVQEAVYLHITGRDCQHILLRCGHALNAVYIFRWPCYSRKLQK